MRDTLYWVILILIFSTTCTVVIHTCAFVTYLPLSSVYTHVTERFGLFNCMRYRPIPLVQHCWMTLKKRIESVKFVQYHLTRCSDGPNKYCFQLCLMLTNMLDLCTVSAFDIIQPIGPTMLGDSRKED